MRRAPGGPGKGLRHATGSRDVVGQDIVHAVGRSMGLSVRGGRVGQPGTTCFDVEVVYEGIPRPPDRATPGATMRVAALDLGKVRVGLALSDELGLMAHPRPALDARDRRGLLARLVELAREEALERFVVGLPLDARGEDGPAARLAREFAVQVEQSTGLPVEMWDERFTTVEAQRRLREGGRNARSSRKRIDSAAACVLLQSWLDGLSRRAP